MAEVRAEVQARFPEMAIHRCELIPGGWDHAMLLVNGEWIFRVPLRPENEVTLEKELRLLPELAPALPVAAPRYEHVSRRDGPFPRIVAGYRRIPGGSLSPSDFEGAHGASLAKQVAAFLTALHAFPLERAETAGIPRAGPDAWRRAYQEVLGWIRREAFPILDPRERRWTLRLGEAYLADPTNVRFAPVLLHRDLEAAHLLRDAETGLLTGVIDWGDASVGDPAFDFAGLLKDLGEPVARSVLEAYRGTRDAGILGRARFYAAIAPFYGIIYGRQLGHPEWTREGLERLRALVD